MGFLAGTTLVDTENLWGFTEYGLRQIWLRVYCSSGRAPATKPLHPGRTSSKGKKRALPSDNVDAVRKRGSVKFSNPPGPKRGHPSSLLPGSSPAKKQADAREKKVNPALGHQKTG
jgi:hypothetical protein